MSRPILRPTSVLLVLLASLPAASLVGQDNNRPAATKDLSDDLVPVDGNTYHNDFAGLTLQVPDDATVMTEDKVQEIAKENHKLVEERSSRVRDANKKGHKSTTLFRLHLKQPEVKTLRLLPGITAWQEEIKKDRTVTPERFLVNLRKAMQQASNIKYREEFFSKTIDDLTFTFQLGLVTVKKDDRVITGIQEQHVVILADRAIGFALTYNTTQEGNQLRDILWTLKLDKEEENVGETMPTSQSVE